MLTIITLKELEKLYRNMKLEGSITFNFVPPNSASLLRDLYLRKTSDLLGEFFLLKTFDGKQIEDYAPNLDGLDDSIFDHLPKVDDKYVAILVNPKSYTLLFGSESYNRLVDLGKEDDESLQDLKRKISRQRVKDEALVYAVSSVIRAEEVMRVIYPKELESEVLRIAEATKARRKALGATNIFGKE